jgi:ectoine hydroxylase-related dioxygenase (phytanoyl-CoA dioxygenase family)
MVRTGAALQRAFDVRGFVIFENVFTDDEVRRARDEFDRLAARAASVENGAERDGAVFFVHPIERGPRAGSKAIDRVCWAGAAEPVLRRIGEDRRLLEPVSRLLGSDSMDHLINQAHFKLPDDGVTFPWHQDSTHRRYGTDLWTDVNGRGSYVQTVLALDDVDEHNGPLRFLPGSQRAGHLGLPREGTLPSELAAIEPVAATMKAGSVALFGPYVVHGSSANRSSRSRRVLINGYAYRGANRRVYPGRGAGRRLDLDERASA